MKKMIGTFNTVRKMAASLISTIDTISAIASGGLTANTNTMNQAELRDMRIMLPYGIASSGLDGMRVQVIISDEEGSIVGVYDTDRPSVNPGELVLYSKDAMKIKLANKIVVNDGTHAVARVGDTVEVNVPGIGTCTGTITSGNTDLLA